MKVLTSIALLAGADQQLQMSINDVEQFIAGLIFGLIQEDDLSKIQQCLTNADTLEKEIVEAFDDFSKGDINSIMSGIEVVGEILEQLP